MSLKQKQKNHCELLGNGALGGAEDLRINLPIHSPKGKASKVPRNISYLHSPPRAAFRDK